jgi:hypothetical protein
MYFLLLTALPVSARFATYMGATLRPELTRTQLAHTDTPQEGTLEIAIPLGSPRAAVSKKVVQFWKSVAGARSQTH